MPLKRGTVRILLQLFAVSILLVASTLPLGMRAFQTPPASTQQGVKDSADEFKSMAALEPIDAHIHVFKSDPAVYALIDRLHLHLLDICVVVDRDPKYPQLQEQVEAAMAVVRGDPSHASWCTSFDPYNFNSPHFSAEAIRLLDRDFANGAVAVKIWKNVGMKLQTPDGKFVMPDDPAFQPIYHDIAAHHKTLIAHLAEPTSCWQPPNPASPDYSYYQEHPEWYMYMKPDHPSKEKILAARDHLLAMNPDLKVVGAHLGSMEVDLDALAQHFDRYPNFAVDMAARVPYLMIQPRDKVRVLLLKYQDRFLYGTDLELSAKEYAGDLHYWKSTYGNDWKFLATNELVEYKGQKYQGLALPEAVLRKIYHDNAVRWIPGVIAQSDTH